MNKILVVDDEENIRDVLAGILEDEGYQVETAKDGLEGLSKAETGLYNLILLDVWLPGIGGIEILEKIKSKLPFIEVIVISGHGNIDMAVKAVKKGAFDFLEKPLSLDKVITVVKNALTVEQLRKENQELKDAIVPEDSVTGTSAAIENIRVIIKQVAASDAPVLITGENGTGKELAAKEIYRQSQRKSAPFIEVNCASIPDSLIESELFGHEKGAFTGAISSRKGKFELADGGTLFLDEIADMSLNAQAKVLRAVQEMKFERVGSEKSVQVDVRIICATNKDLMEEVEKGRFREDLFFRINVIPIHMPPLRERKEDIPALGKYFFSKYNKEDRQPDSPERKISPEGYKALTEYDWPGNIRELKNMLKRLYVMTDEENVTADTIRQYIHGVNLGSVPPASQKQEKGKFPIYFDSSAALNDAKDFFERSFILKKLEKNGYNITRTAKEIGMYPGNLHQKLKKLGIDLE